MKYLHKLSQERTPESKEFAKMAKRFEFDGPTFTSSSYNGEQALPYVSAALKSGRTLDNGWINVLDNIPYKGVINRVEGSNLIVDATCDFTDAGAVTVTERVLAVDEFQVNIDLCKKTMRTGWQAAETGNSLNSRMPAAFEDYVIGHVAGLVGQRVEESIWNGNGGTTGQFTGFATAAVADPAFTGGSFVTDATVSDVDLGAAADMTAANMVAKMELVLDDVSSQVLAHPEFALYVSPKTAFLYQQKLGAQGYANDYQANAKPANIYGYPVYACPGIQDTDIIGTYRSNLNFGSNIQTNLTEVQVIDRSPIDGSDNVRFVMRYAAGVQHGVGADISFGRTTS